MCILGKYLAHSLFTKISLNSGLFEVCVGVWVGVWVGVCLKSGLESGLESVLESNNLQTQIQCKRMGKYAPNLKAAKSKTNLDTLEDYSLWQQQEANRIRPMNVVVSARMKTR